MRLDTIGFVLLEVVLQCCIPWTNASNVGEELCVSEHIANMSDTDEIGMVQKMDKAVIERHTSVADSGDAEGDGQNEAARQRVTENPFGNRAALTELDAESGERATADQTIGNADAFRMWTGMGNYHAYALAGGVSMILLLTFVPIWLCVRSSTPVEASLSLSWVVQFWGWLAYSLIIPESYDLSIKVHSGAAFSGLLIGCYSFASAFGSVTMFIILKIQEDAYLSRVPLFFTVSSYVLGSLLYLLAAHGVDARNGRTWASPTYLQWMLVSSRLVFGFGKGFHAQRYVVSITQLVPQNERPDEMFKFYLGTMLGVGLGPIIAACIRFVAGGSMGFTAVALLTPVISICLLAAIIAWFPSKAELLVAQSNNFQKAMVTAGANDLQPHMMKRAAVIAGCLIMSTLRGYVVSAVEVGSALLLETTYHWKLEAIGVAISFTFLGCIPLRLLANVSKGTDADSNRAWVRVLACCALLGTLLLLKTPQRWASWFVDGGFVLLLADAFIFPPLFLADVISISGMQQYFGHTGSWLSANPVTIVWVTLADAARALGPALCRLSIQEYGQDVYAWSMSLVCVSFIIVFEILCSAFNFFHPLEGEAGIARVG